MSNIRNIKNHQMNQQFVFPIRPKQSNKLQVNNTPIKVRSMTTKQNNGLLRNPANQPNIPIQIKQVQHNTSLSQNNAKTIPKKKIQTNQKRCVNHNDNQAEFRISIQTQYIHYCNKCAINLASNGFQVQRIPKKSPKINKQIKNTIMKKQQQLSSFISSLKKIEHQYKLKHQSLYKLEQNNKKQRQIIFNFYNDIHQYIQNVRDEHFQYLNSQSQRNVQICQIQGDEIAQSLEEIDGIYHDIQNNMDKIIQDVDEGSYMQCMNHYHQKVNIYDHRLGQIGIETKMANCTTAECIDNKLTTFKLFIDDMTGMLSSKASEYDY